MDQVQKCISAYDAHQFWTRLIMRPARCCNGYEPDAQIVLTKRVSQPATANLRSLDKIPGPRLHEKPGGREYETVAIAADSALEPDYLW
jgi:hypothetical protein